MEYLMAFGSTHKALKAEEVLRGYSIAFRLLPAPRALEPYCDLVISIREEDLGAAKEALAAGGVRPKSTYRKEGEGYVKV